VPKTCLRVQTFGSLRSTDTFR